MVLGDKPKNYLPSSPSPLIIVSSPVPGLASNGNFIFTKRTINCVQVKVVTMDAIFIKLLP